MLVSPSLSTSAGDVHTRNRETLSRFSSDSCEFFRIGNDPNRLNLPLLHINGQGSDLGEVVLEDFAQQEDRSLERLELLQQHQERQRDRLFPLDTLCWIF